MSATFPTSIEAYEEIEKRTLKQNKEFALIMLYK